MCRRMTYWVSFALASSLVLTAVVKADLIGWWVFDEGTGTTVADVSGAGHDGVFAEGTPQWVEGMFGMALSFDGSNKVEIPDHPDFHLQDAVSMALWMRPEAGQPSYAKPFIKQKSGEYPYAIQYDSGGENIRATVNASARFDTSSTPNFAGQWAHMCMTYDGSAVILYKDGEEVGRIDATGALQQNDLSLSIGGRLGSGQNFIGTIDDVRLYSHALTVEEIQAVMIGEGFACALGPDPADGAFHADTWVNLSWSPGEYVVSHDVYLGDNFDAVDNDDVIGETFRGNQTATSYVAGFPGFAYPDGLVPGTTYYWRIDEVNDADPNSPWKGNIWSFSIPPKTAYDPDPANGNESVALNAELSWTGGFGAKLHTVYFGDNFDDVSNAAGGLPQATTTFSPPGPLELAKTYHWRVDEFDVVATYTGDVWSFTTEGTAANPNPAAGAVDVSPTPILSWSPAKLAASHEVYFGADVDAVKNADKTSPEHKGTRALGDESYDAGRLELETTYYWRIDEVNSTHPGSPWIGNVWNFTTGNFLVIDDFESYNDIDPPDDASNRIFDKWIDGFGTTTNGALVGNDLPPYAEQNIVHGGGQSMIYSYDNAGKTSEATLTLSERDWTAQGVVKLALWFRGDSGNAADRMFVALGNAVVYHDDPAATQIAGWNEWVIDLQVFTDQGVALTNVNTITIGFGTKNSPAAGGTGTMYFDDIRLVR